MSEPHTLLAAPSPWATIAQTLRSSFKKPGPVPALPSAQWVRPQVVLTADDIARYRACCGFEDRAGVPLTYPQLLGFPLGLAYMNSPECPWPALGTVHLSNHITQHAPLAVGDALRVVLQTGALRAHDKGQAFTVELHLWRDNACIWSCVQTVLRLGVRPAYGEPYAPAVASAPELRERAPLDAPADIGRRYARVSGDFNPIHLSALTAKPFGFPRAIAHGLWTQARALATLHPQGGQGAASLACDFHSPLRLPARATVWTAPDARHGRFEVRDAQGQRCHLRAELTQSSS